ncbi:hypothetical protein [Pandoraea sp.]
MKRHKQLSKRMIALHLIIREARQTQFRRVRRLYWTAVHVWEQEGGRAPQ